MPVPYLSEEKLMTTTTTQDATSALLIHLNPSQGARSGSHGDGVYLNCGCGEVFDVEQGHVETGPDGRELRGWTLVRRQHADHVRAVTEALIAQDAEEAAGPVDSEETRAVPALDRDGETGEVAADGRLISEFAQEHGLRPDWHEPDERGVGARIIGTHLDNAFGAMAGRHVSFDGHDFSEFNVILTVEDDEGVPRDAAVVNLASLLAIAAAAR